MVTIPDWVFSGKRPSHPNMGGPRFAANDRSLAEIAELLSCISPDCSYDDWIAAMMAVHHETSGSMTGFSIVDSWSARGAKYKGSRDVEGHWRSFKSGGVTGGTLASLAREHGADLSEIARKHKAPDGAPEDDSLNAKAEAEEAPRHKSGTTPTGPSIRATPFAWKDPASIPPRDWLYGSHLIRRFLSGTVAPGGVGKSSLTIAEALAMVSGRPLLDVQVYGGPKRVWLWNLEDPIDELDRRVMATCLHYSLSELDVADRLFVDSGRAQGLCTAVVGKDGARIVKPVTDALVAELRARKVDVLIVDPFVSSHQVPENDNVAIDLVAKEWARIADEANCAISLVHHTRKQNGYEITAESSRGAGAFVAATRDTRAINRMTQDEAAQFGIENGRTFFRAYSDKGNLAPPADRSDWYQLVSVDLGNGDSVGVVQRWTPPDMTVGFTLDDLKAVQVAVAAGKFRENIRSSEWVGVAVADALDLDIEDPNVRKRIKTMLALWIKNGALVVVEGKDEKRNKRTFVEVGELA